MLPFELVVHGPPVSQQTRRRARRRAWIEELREAVIDRWPADEPPALGPIRVTITHVYAEVAVDLDNLAKPVLDALKELVYHDDGQVIDIMMRKRGMARDLRILVHRGVQKIQAVCALVWLGLRNRGIQRHNG